MTVQDYLRILRERWLIVLIALLLGVGGGAAAYFVRPPQYTASLQMYVSAQTGGSAESAFSGAQLSAQRVKSYTELASSPRIASEVIAQLNLDKSEQQLSSQITAASSENSIVIHVAVTDIVPTRAAAIANAVGTALTRLVDELERPQSPSGISPVVVRVVQPAPVPTTASSTSLTRLLALGLLVGLALGVAAAIVRNAMDTSIKTIEQLREAAGAPNLGEIAYDSQAPKRPLIVHDEPHSPRAEAFRQLRTNVQFVDAGNPHKVLLVTSARPSEGKTTTLANLAIALASAGSRILIIDADLRRPKVAEIFGLDSAVGLTTVLTGRVPTGQAIQQWGGGSIDLLASGVLPPNPSELLASPHMRALLADVRGRYDLVLIDTPPLLPVTDAATIAPATDGAIFVCRVQETSRIQVETATEALRAVDAPIRGTVLTMVSRKAQRMYSQYNSLYQIVQSPIPPHNRTRQLSPNIRRPVDGEPR